MRIIIFFYLAIGCAAAIHAVLHLSKETDKVEMVAFGLAIMMLWPLWLCCSLPMPHIGDLQATYKQRQARSNIHHSRAYYCAIRGKVDAAKECIREANKLVIK